MPIIRYRTRDLTRLLPGTCRNDDMMIIRGANVFPTQIEEIIVKIPALTPHYHCEFSRPERMDILSVVFEE